MEAKISAGKKAITADMTAKKRIQVTFGTAEYVKISILVKAAYETIITVCQEA